MKTKKLDIKNISKRVYLDHSATTPLHPEVKKALIKAMEIYGNPSSMYLLGREAKKLMENSRNTVADFLGADPQEIIFTGSGTEASNQVLSIFSHKSLAGKELITTKIEHPCVLETAKFLQSKGINVQYLDVDNYGKINIEQLQNIISEKTGLVAVMMANNEIGTVQDIKKITEIAHQHGALCYSDAVQAVGKIPINVKELDIDFLSFSGHKIYAPKGIGALYIKKGTPLVQFIHGGHQENARRAGTENTLGIAGLQKAIEMRKLEMHEEHKRLIKLRKLLIDGIEKNIPDIRINSHPKDNIAAIVNVSFAGAEGESVLLYLDFAGIDVSTGSACATGSLEPSHVMLAIGASWEYAHGSIRISMGRETSAEDIEYVLETLPGIINKLRSMSSSYRSSK